MINRGYAAAPNDTLAMDHQWTMGNLAQPTHHHYQQHHQQAQQNNQAQPQYMPSPDQEIALARSQVSCSPLLRRFCPVADYHYCRCSSLFTICQHPFATQPTSVKTLSRLLLVITPVLLPLPLHPTLAQTFSLWPVGMDWVAEEDFTLLPRPLRRITIITLPIKP
jgi:hypothetical protein